MANSMQNQWQWFENWLAETDAEVLNDFNDGCSLEQLAEIENETGIKLPQSFKDFYLTHNGQKDEDYFGLDFEPEINGTVGQVINFGREEEQKAVLASSFEEFIDWYIRELERENYLIYSEDGYKQFIPKEYKERFFRGYNYFLGEVAKRFISL